MEQIRLSCLILALFTLIGCQKPMNSEEIYNKNILWCGADT